LSDDHLASLRAHSIGLFFQTFNLLPYLTAQQNVAAPNGVQPRREGRERSDQLLTQVGLKQRGKHTLPFCQAVNANAWPSQGHWPINPPCS